jgi:hypothetical protein
MTPPTYSSYKNKPAILLENDLISALFLPGIGGKLCSLISKKTGYEFMVQRPGLAYKEQPFDGVYTEGECSGFDDMFPTIDVCYYENEPWKNVKMADHGEVWSLPWDYSVASDSLCMSVQGMRFPYRLEKKVRFFSDDTLRFDYTLTNQSRFDFEFLWAGHLMLNIEVGTTIVVPNDCRQMVTILTNGSGKFGDVHDWPYLKDKDGHSYRADISRPKETQGFEKYYFMNKLQDGWCELLYPDKKNRFKVSFAAETIPYLGLLMNENGWDNLYNIIIEPCSICYDRPDVAKKYGQVSKIDAMGSMAWWMEVTL